MSSFDRSLLQIFATEQADHIARMRARLDELASGASRSVAHLFEELLRRAHTLKGAARSVGLEPTELLIHRMEDKLVELHRSGAPLEPGTHGGFKRALDAAEDILAAALESATLPDVSRVLRAMEEGTTVSAPPREVAERHEAESAVSLDGPMEFVRVRAGYLDELIRASSELLMSVTANRDGERVRAHASRLDAIDQEWTRLRRRADPFLHESKDDPGTAVVAECFSYIGAKLNGLRREAHATADEVHTTARRFQLQAQSVSQNASRIRMTPAETVFGSLGAMVRDLAQREGKRVEFSAEGLDVEGDRLVLQALKDPVMHLLRNAVSHGIEPEGVRLSRSKPAAGTIRLRITALGDRLRIDVEDDGQGLDRRAIADAARRRRMGKTVEPDEGDTELSELIFQPGFSTAAAVTRISGRGMGLSAAREAVRKLHGEVSIQQIPGSGVIASLSAPLSIASQHVLFVTAAGQKFALATAQIEKLYRIPATELTTFQGRESVVIDAEPVPVSHLTTLLQLPGTTSASDPVLDMALLAVEGHRIALVVDEFVEQRESIIRESGLPPSHAGMTSGAIPLEDGTVAVMLDVHAIFEKAQSGPGASVPATARPVAAKTPKILVVDDSITSRSLERTILEANGYQVELAVDGLEALERLQTDPPDLVITDVAMPRLTGFQLLERMKTDESLKAIPVILITSLDSREDQERGLSLGADAYIVKRKFDQRELLSVIRQIL